MAASLLLAVLGGTGCSVWRAPWDPYPEPGADAASADTAAPAASDSPAAPPPTVEALREQGPTDVAYDLGPRLRGGEWRKELLRSTVAPVIDEHDLPVETFARFWVLVDRAGEVRDAVLQRSSRSEAFDRAARAAATRLRYTPAFRDGRPIPVWVLARISVFLD